MRLSLSVVLAATASSILAACGSEGPKCKTIDGTFDVAYPQIYWFYQHGVNTLATTDTLSARYAFTAIRVDTATGLVEISAPQPPSVVKGLECEPSIWLLGYDGPINPDAP